MKNFIEHSTVIAGSALVFGKLGHELGETAARMHYEGVRLPLGANTFEALGAISGTYVGLVVGIASVALNHLRKTN